MTNIEFKYWLQGYYQLSNTISLQPKQLYIVHNHLKLVKAVEGSLSPENESISQAYEIYLENQTRSDQDIEALNQLIYKSVYCDGLR